MNNPFLKIIYLKERVHVRLSIERIWRIAFLGPFGDETLSDVTIIWSDGSLI
jgi:hypothetical protein